MSLEIPKYHFDLNLQEVPDSAEEFLQFIQKCRTELVHISEEDRRSILVKLGFALRVTRQLKEAKKVFKEALELCSTSNIESLIGAKIRLAHVYQWEACFDISNEIFEELEQLYLNKTTHNSIKGTYWQHRGKNEFDQKNFSKALIYFEKALSIREGDSAPSDQIESSKLAIRRTKELLSPKGYLDSKEAFIRRATIADAEEIHNAHMRSIQEICSKDHSEAEIKAWGSRSFNKEQRESAIKNDFVWVVEAAETIQGYGHLRLFAKDGLKQGHIFGLYLTPQVFGKKFGQRIVSLMLEQAKEFGAQKISLESTISAHSFYGRNGFRDNGPMTVIKINNQEVRCYPMTLDLTSKFSI